MATGPEHYREAERLLAVADSYQHNPAQQQVAVSAAQVHATLAHAAADALSVTATLPPPVTEAGADWREVLSPPGHGEAVAS